MKKTMKKCFAMLLALAMLFAMAVPAAAAATTEHKQTVTFTEVATGDTVKAYRVMEYGEDYNSYVYDEGFKHAMLLAYGGEENFDQHFADFKNAPEALMGYLTLYVTSVLNGTLKSKDGTITYHLPAVFAEGTADGEGKAALELDPGYYLFLVETTSENSKVYSPVTAFVQVKNGEVKIYAGYNSADITLSKEVAVKHQAGPTIETKVWDDDAGAETWKDTAAGSVGEAMEFYTYLTIPAYKGVTDMPTLELVNTLTNLTYVENSATVYKTTADGTANVENALIEVVPVTGTDGQQTVTFQLKYNTGNSGSAINLRNDDGSVGVYIRYKAVVQPAAAEKGVNATDSAVLRYATSLESTKVKTAEAAANTVYTYAFSLAKHSDTLVDKNDKTKGFESLSNAAFSVYDKDKTAAIQMVKVTTAAGEVYYRPAAADETDTVTVLPADQGAGKNTLLVRGLDVKEYTVAEVKTPSGFYAPKGDFKVDLEGERDATMGTLSGNLKNTSTFTHKADADKTLINGAAVLHGDDLSRLDASLKNSSSPLLPTTGGVGTVMFTVVGVALMGLALWFFLLRRRRDEE